MFNRYLFVFAAIAALAFAGTAAAETILISDTFPSETTTAGNGIHTYSPEISYAEDSWHRTRASSSDDLLISSAGNPANSVLMSNNGGACTATGISSLTDDILHVSADIMLDGLYGANICRGIGVGFFPSINTASTPGHYNFTGLVVDEAGNVSYIKNSGGNWTFLDEGTVAWAGSESFSTSSWYTLSYDVDMATGFITNISLSGSTADYSSLCNINNGWLTSTSMQYGGFYGSGEADDATGNLDNYKLVHGEVPEPSTLALLGCGLIGLLAYAWRKRK